MSEETGGRPQPTRLSQLLRRGSLTRSVRGAAGSSLGTICVIPHPALLRRSRAEQRPVAPTWGRLGFVPPTRVILLPAQWPPLPPCSPLATTLRPTTASKYPPL